MQALLSTVLASLFAKLGPQMLPVVERAAIDLARKALTAAKNGTFPDYAKAYEPFCDAIADAALVELAKIEAALLAPKLPAGA